ncbi:hypothetical protein [Sphingomonas cavernae]|uniref:Uncharacterized protein n=1 Tax=Sphingomonas cavernae TaxID=2320861 RepID=A0A418WL59_9SPHN|nr:hypothetical protein [Sphingomonas cavernae]RJF90781.1 hypothetical protein D3876_11350 [Sphingomonas cavernae]
MSIYLKDPQARIDYAIDWNPGFLAGASIAESAWSVSPEEPGGVEVDTASMLGVKTIAVLAGGVAGQVYRIANRVTLSDGRIDERSIVLRAEHR